MRAHLALSHRQQELVTLHSTGSVLPVKDRLHIKPVTAVLKGQRIQLPLPESSFLPACTQAQTLPQGNWSSIRHFHGDLWEQSVPSVLKFPGTAAAVACHSWRRRPMGCSNGPVSYLPHGSDDTYLYSLCPFEYFHLFLMIYRVLSLSLPCHIITSPVTCIFFLRLFIVEPLQIYRTRVPTYPIHTPVSPISDVFH